VQKMHGLPAGCFDYGANVGFCSEARLRDLGMRVELGWKRNTRTKDPNLAMIRRAMTEATSAYGIGGVKKRRGGPKPVSLAPVNLPPLEKS
jgi:hypothetical protein